MTRIPQPDASTPHIDCEHPLPADYSDEVSEKYTEALAKKVAPTVPEEWDHESESGW